MNAVVMHQLGGPEVLRYQEWPDPEPEAGEVLVEVEAATVNRTDIFHRSGRFFIQKDLPHILGMDVAGRIAALGPEVTGWAVDDRVVATFEELGRASDGAYAELVTVPVEELHRIPDGLDYIHAAAIGRAFATAWVALVHHGRMTADDTVLIQAASSGVGTSAVQIAHARGARVIALSSAGKADRLKELGADIVVDRNRNEVEDLVANATDGHGPSLVLELVGRRTLQSSIEMAADNGRVIIAGTISGDEAEIDALDVLTKNLLLRGSSGRIRDEEWEEILSGFAAGTYKAVIDEVLPLSAAAEAHERLEDGETFGKLVLSPRLDREP
ncbi:MAG: zinc-binding dehydrogenase [Candidatus Dormiibacterota bacterium]